MIGHISVIPFFFFFFFFPGVCILLRVCTKGVGCRRPNTFFNGSTYLLSATCLGHWTIVKREYTIRENLARMCVSALTALPTYHPTPSSWSLFMAKANGKGVASAWLRCLWRRVLYTEGHGQPGASPCVLYSYPYT
jgi:hypothetical protein